MLLLQFTFSKPWHNSYRLGPFQLPVSLAPYPRLPLYTVLDQSASRNPSSIAVDYYGKTLTYQELKLQCDQMAAGLARLGVEPGDRVVTVLPNCPQYIISTFAILKAGAVHVPCSPLHKKRELEHQINESGATVLICPARYYIQMRPALLNTNLQTVIVTSPRDYTALSSSPKKLKGTVSFRNLIARHPPRAPQVRINPTRDLAYLTFTGGATGRPKGVMLTHYNRLCNVLQGLPWMMGHYEKQIRGRGSIMIPVPLFHSYGDWVMLSAIYWGMKIILVRDPRDTDTILKLMIDNRPFLVSAVPTQIMKLQEKGLPHIPSRIMSGSALLPAEVEKSFYKTSRAPISEGYGLTEASPVTHINLSGFSRLSRLLGKQKHSIGVPVPDTDVRLIDEETGRRCSTGEPGHMYIKGPQVMKGYWPRPGSGLVDGWLPTGDIVRMDEDGYFYIVDRIKDMVNVSGNKVYTSVIDEILHRHPAVAVAATIGIPDPERPGSERVKAIIQLKEGYLGTVSARDIINFCKEHCPPYAVPRSITFRKALPLTATQKVFKRKLREEELRKLSGKH